MPPGKKKTIEPVSVLPVSTETITISIIGMSPLITHAWAEKSKKEMRDKQMGLPRAKKQPKDPFSDYVGALYNCDNSGKRFGIQVNAIKNAMVNAASFVQGLTKVQLRGALFVEADVLREDGTELVEIIGIPQMREDNVRLATGVADLRHRPCFVHWGAKLQLTFDTTIFRRDAVINLLNRAGFSVGLCEWRPEKNGNFGRFRVATPADEKKLKQIATKQKKMKSVFQTRAEEEKRMGFEMPTEKTLLKIQAEEEKKKAAKKKKKSPAKKKEATAKA